MGFFSQKMRSLFSSKSAYTDEEWPDLSSSDPQRGEGGGPELDEGSPAERGQPRAPRTSPELTGAFTSDPDGGVAREPEGARSVAKESPLILNPSREASSEVSALEVNRVLPSDELSYDPDESIEVPVDIMESYSGAHRRAHSSRQVLSPLPQIEEWQEDLGEYDEDEPAPQTVFSLPILPGLTPQEDEATIAPPSALTPHPEVRVRRRLRPSIQPAPPSGDVFKIQETLGAGRRLRVEQLIAPVHIPSLQEMSVMMRHWLTDRIKLHRDEEMSDEEADELHQVWHGYFELRPDDHQAKLEYGWFMLDFHGKDAAHDYFHSQYQSSDAPDQYLFALTSLSYRTGDSLGACEYMKVLFDRLPEDLQVLELKLEIERSLRKVQEAEETERLIYRQRGLQESVGGY